MWKKKTLDAREEYWQFLSKMNGRESGASEVTTDYNVFESSNNNLLL